MPIQRKYWHFYFIEIIMQVKDCYKIGFVMKPHGLKGEVTISIEDDIPNEIESLDKIFIEQTNGLVPYFIENISVKGSKAYLKLEDVDSTEAATAISKSAIYLPKTERPKSSRGEFYDDEIVAFEVHDNEFGLIGRVVEVTLAGSNKLLSIDREGKEILIPINSPFIESINKSKKRITVSLPDGFLDI
ncbi:ribosome maturation factor RimM [Chryseosolibacter indicus]|uniref:Ribosome maturation factor RimM n=1 Tax=Chryseosolibacter indicus TaxID=2782351 RepID=A0ABS5VSE3_9BACT|nr:ribosome maturation factor RimM [Chryseosolibacter indicus]MBT1704271.1 16S rRNA processing protein RimM [Chryseosolibacter indicus]